MTIQKHFLGRLHAFCASRLFFKIIVALFVVQAAWIALASAYPMAFDEDFHLGLIRLYAHHISPFWSSQPPSANIYGAVAHDPSYLYQWLMSFPYRFISLFTHSQPAIVMFLRAINIALFAAALPLFRKLLLRSKASSTIVNGCLLVFVLLPVVTQMAAQINYDNLFIPVIAWVLLLTLRVKDQLALRRVPLRNIALLLGICLLASLIKYAFLPIFLSVVVYVGFYAWRYFGKYGTAFRGAIKDAYQTMPLRTRWILGVFLIISTLLFLQRYGINTVQYHSPIPRCDKVLSVKQCSAYGPWSRDYNLHLTKDIHVSADPIGYLGQWFAGMWQRIFFAVAGPGNNFQTGRTMPIPSLTAIIVALLALIALGVTASKLLRRYDRSVLALFGLVTAIYIGSLWFDEYKEFLRTGQAVAINGRYLFPVTLFVMLVGALALYQVFQRFRRSMAIGAIVIVLCMAWGGGVLTYVLRSQPNWYWHNQFVRTVNHTVKRTVGPLTPGYKTSNKFW